MMRRMVLGAQDGKVGDGRDADAVGATVAGVTLLLPETCDEYERARAEVASLARIAAGGETAAPTEGGPDGTDAAPGADRWVVTTREQRRAWDLRDLEADAAGIARTCEELPNRPSPLIRCRVLIDLARRFMDQTADDERGEQEAEVVEAEEEAQIEALTEAAESGPAAVPGAETAALWQWERSPLDRDSTVFLADYRFRA